MKTKDKLSILVVLFSLIFVFYAFFVLPSALSWGPLNNNRNFSVKTTVNITDAMPEILNITCNGGAAVSLVPGSRQNVTCLVQLRDYNGGNTINGTNGSGINTSMNYYFLNKSNDPDDNNVHYTNFSCALNGTANGYYINWSCGFYPWYYANNGSWIINVSVYDRYNNKSYNVSGTQNFSITSLYALNVTDTIDFGDRYVGETSPTAIQANVTNFGNMNINLSVYGYGADNITLYSTLAMVCSVRNLSSSTERYSLNGTLPWASMTSISATATQIPNITMPQQQDDANMVVNATYWRLYVDPSTNPFGQCNGTVVFSAIAAN